MAWVLPLWLLVSITAPSYESVYPSLETRTVLIEQMRKSPGTRLLYGYVPAPGRLGQLLQWETGTFLLVCTALMAILLTCRMLRGDEDEGFVEVLRATGVGRIVLFLVPMALVWAVVGALSVGVGGILTWQTGEYRGADRLRRLGAGRDDVRGRLGVLGRCGGGLPAGTSGRPGPEPVHARAHGRLQRAGGG